MRAPLLWLTAGVCACASGRASEPFTGQVVLANEAQLRGQQVFSQHCHRCHPNGGAGLGPAVNNKPMPTFLLRAQVRRGIGAMPAFDEQVIPDAQLDALVEYLLALRRHAD